MAFFGAGVWGFLHTLSFINYYTHGTQVTAAHGHLAFYGAYAMINLAMMTYAMPQLLRRVPYNQVLNMWSFWVLTGGVTLMSVVLTFAGVLQTHLERVMAMDFMEVQQQLTLFYIMRLVGGVFVTIGAALFIVAVLLPSRRVIASVMSPPHRAAGTPAE